MEIKIIIKKSNKNGRYYATVTNGIAQKFLDLETAMLLVGASYSDINGDVIEFIITSRHD